jgi:hypothetical protein
MIVAACPGDSRARHRHHGADPDQDLVSAQLPAGVIGCGDEPFPDQLLPPAPSEGLTRK